MDTVLIVYVGAVAILLVLVIYLVTRMETLEQRALLGLAFVVGAIGFQNLGAAIIAGSLMIAWAVLTAVHRHGAR